MKISNCTVDEITHMYSGSLAEGFTTLLRVVFEHDVTFPNIEVDEDGYDAATEVFYDDFNYSLLSEYVGYDLDNADVFEADWRDPNELWLSVR